MPTSTKTSSHPGGCACGQVRFRLTREPMFVHACHCTRCQRETGGPFAHHAMIEWSAFEVTEGEPSHSQSPTDSGAKHWVARCPTCQTAMWNEWGALGKAVTRYVRVGTLDNPHALPPLAHIFVRSKQAWVVLPAEVPQFSGYYNVQKTWPAESLARYEAAKAALKTATKNEAKPAASKPARKRQIQQ